MVHKKTKKPKQSKSVLTPFGYFVLGQMSMNTRTPINSPSPLYVQTTPQLMTQPMQYPIITSASPSPEILPTFPISIPKVKISSTPTTNMIPPTPFATIPTQSLPPQTNFSFFVPPPPPIQRMKKLAPSSESSTEIRRSSRNKKNT